LRGITIKEKLIEILRPTLPVVVLAAALVLLSLIIFVTSEATSMVSWDQYRGAPLIALHTLNYTGPCGDAVPCKRISLGELFPVALLIDLIFWYLISALILFGVKILRAVIKI
jgi:hypothetical protein